MYNGATAKDVAAALLTDCLKGKRLMQDMLARNTEMVVSTTTILAMKSKQRPLRYSRTRIRSEGI